MNFNSTNQKTILLVFLSLLISSLLFIIYCSNNIQKQNYESLDKKVILINAKKKPVNKKTKNLTIENYKPIKNTSESIIKDWNNIANIIFNNYKDQDSFVILVEPETITYLSSALAFILENINKPVILTTDDLNNTLKLSTKIKYPEVMINSDKKLLRGCCSVQLEKNKISSPNYQVLTKNNCLKQPIEDFRPKYLKNDINIIVVKFFPGININYILSLIDNQKIDGIILELYCEIKINISSDILDLLKKLIQDGIIIISVSQCNYYDNIDINLLSIGIITGFDMTSSSAYTKLLFILSYVEDKTIIPQLFERSLRGEISQKYSMI